MQTVDYPLEQTLHFSPEPADTHTLPAVTALTADLTEGQRTKRHEEQTPDSIALLAGAAAAHRSLAEEPVHTESQAPSLEERREEKHRKRQELLPRSGRPLDAWWDRPPSSAPHEQRDDIEQTASCHRDSASPSLQSTDTGRDAQPSAPPEWCYGRKRTERRWCCTNTFLYPYPSPLYIPKPHLNPSETGAFLGPTTFAPADGRKFARGE